MILITLYPSWSECATSYRIANMYNSFQLSRWVGSRAAQSDGCHHCLLRVRAPDIVHIHRSIEFLFCGRRHNLVTSSQIEAMRQAVV